MRTIRVLLMMALLAITLASLARAQEPVKPIDMSKAQPRVMGLYEQGWHEGAKIGNQHSGKVGWFFAGFGNLPLMWLPWTVEPRHPAKPPIVAEEEFNSGFKNGHRAGWKNAHKTFYIAGMIVSSAAAGAIIVSQAN
jgi:hypothetical protein